MFGTVRGFTLIELLVGIVIALLGSLAVMQAYTGRESDRRNIGSLADAQNNALIAMFMIERDLQQAGMGFSNLRALGCTVGSPNGLDGATMASVAVIPAGSVGNGWNLPEGDAGSDMLVVMYGVSANTSEGYSVARTTAAGDTTIPVAGVQGILMNDTLLLAEQGRACTLGQVQSVTVGSEEVTINFPAVAGHSTAARMFNLGPQPRFLAYAVRNGNLTMCNFALADCSGGEDDPSIWFPIVNDIVAIVAQYGADTSVPPDGAVDTYCGKWAGGACGGATAMTACDHARAPAMRIAIVARSPQAEKDEVFPTETIKLWPDSEISPATVGPEWNVPDRHYRYRVATTSVALRNIQLMGVQSGC